MDAIKQGITHKTVFYLLVARESLLHRVSGLADDAFQLIDAGRYLSAEILTRSMLESTAVLGFLLRGVEAFERTNDISALYDWVAKVVVGARNGDEGGPVSVHVLDAIRDSDARLPVSGLMRLYENLSEFAHPNWSGLLGTRGVFGWMAMPTLAIVACCDPIYDPHTRTFGIILIVSNSARRMHSRSSSERPWGCFASSRG